MCERKGRGGGTLYQAGATSLIERIIDDRDDSWLVATDNRK